MIRYCLFLVCALTVTTSTTFALSTPRYNACNFNGTDTDGTNRDDLAVYDPASGNWHVTQLGGPVLVMVTNWGFDQASPVPGDYNGDGQADLAVYFRELGNWYIRTLTGQVLAFGLNWGWNQTVAVPGDYDGDSRADMAVYDRRTGNWFIQSLSGTVIAWATNWGFTDAVPVPGDYNGDGQSDLAVYHRATGNWYIRTIQGEILAFAWNWGWPKAWPVTGDFNGDGLSDLAVYHRATGNWYIQSVGGQVIAWATNWGFVAATPISGDFNGDGKSELGVYHRQLGNWYIRTLTGSILAFGNNWGWNAAIPIQTYACPASEGFSIICFGDSITYGDASASEGPATAYPFLLEKKMYVYGGGYFNIVNAGRSGEATGGGRHRLPTVLDENFGDVLLLMEGTNDALTDNIFKETGDNLFLMVDTALSRGLYAVMATIPPTIATETYDRTMQHKRIMAFNPEIYEIADACGVPVANVHDAITSVPGWETKLMDQATANHPNDAGYQVVRDTFFNTLLPQILSGAYYK